MEVVFDKLKQQEVNQMSGHQQLCKVKIIEIYINVKYVNLLSCFHHIWSVP